MKRPLDGKRGGETLLVPPAKVTEYFYYWHTIFSFLSFFSPQAFLLRPPNSYGQRHWR